MRLFPRREPPPDLDAIAQSAASAAVAAYRAEQEQAREKATAQLAEFRAEMERAQSVGMMGAPPPVPSNGRGRLYARDDLYNWTVPHAPTYHPGSLVDIRTLRRFAQVYDIFRALVNQLKREVEAVPLTITAKDPKDDREETKARIIEVQDWFDVDGGLGGEDCSRAEFEGKVIEDLHVVGPAAIHLAPTRGIIPNAGGRGKNLPGIYEAVPIDSSTIRPVVDPYGFPERGNEYEQWVMGLRHRGFSRSEMYWRGLFPRNDSPYPDSPAEYLVLTIIAAMSSDNWNRSWLTSGTEPGRIIYLPADMTPDNAQFYIDLFLGMMQGNTEKRQQIFFMPGGPQGATNPTRRDHDFQEFMLWLARRCAAVIGVQLASIGFVGEQYKVTQDASMDQTSDVGIAAVLRYLETFYNYLLRRRGYRDLIAQYQTEKDEDVGERAVRNVSLVNGAVKTPNEARQDEGLDPIDGGDVLLVPSTLRPLDQALNPPELATAPGAESSGDAAAQKSPAEQRAAALSEWERRAVANLQMHGHADIRHRDASLSDEERGEIRAGLRGCETEADIRRLFETWQAPEGENRKAEGGNPTPDPSVPPSPFSNFRPSPVEFPPSYHTTVQAHERSMIGRRWAQRRMAAEREA